MSVNLQSRENTQRDLPNLLHKTEFGKDTFDLEWLPGDGSNRMYARVRLKNGESLILMVVNSPEAFRSEEKTGDRESPSRELPFVRIGRQWEKESIRVPHIYAVDDQNRYVLCEDFGDELLFDRRRKAASIEWFERALDDLSLIRSLKAVSPISERHFTEELLQWEFDHFIEYAITKRQKKISDKGLNHLQKFFKGIVSRLSSGNFVVTHRDFHSKNLMILPAENRLGVLDFQDALMAPETYDLVSLLRDSYIRFSSEEENHFLKYFEQRAKTKIDRRSYAEMSLQRNLKAAGRFYYFSLVKGKNSHLPFVKPTLLRVFQTLRDDLKELQMLSLLEGLFQEEIR